MPTPREVRRHAVPFAHSAEEVHATTSTPRQLALGIHTLRLNLPPELSARFPSSVRQHTASFPAQSADSLHSSNPEYLNCVAWPHLEASLQVGGTPGALQHMRREALFIGQADDAPQGTLPGVAATWNRSPSGFAVATFDSAGRRLDSVFAPHAESIAAITAVASTHPPLAAADVPRIPAD